MNTPLLEEILAKEVQLLESASAKEKLFFAFLQRNPTREFEGEPIGDIDQVCVAAYSTNRGSDVTGLIKRNRGAGAIKGIHFSKNLISVVAFSLLSNDVKENELKDFFEGAEPKERFIISHVFPAFAFHEPLVANQFDQIYGIFKLDRFSEEGNETISRALAESHDLTDIFVVREAYRHLTRIHPDYSLRNSASQLVVEFESLISVIEKRVGRIVDIVFIVVMLAVPSAIGLAIKLWWDDWKLEPLTVAFGVFPFFLALILLVLSQNKPEWKLSLLVINFLTALKSWLVERWFLRNGITLAWLKQVVANLRSSEPNQTD